MSGESYLPAIKGMGLTELAAADLGHYQGDYALVVKDEETYDQQYGFLITGYGSCSGCDSWQAADNAGERAQVMVDLLKAARWFETLEEVKAHVSSDEQLLKWHGHEDGWPGFVEAVKALTS